MSERKVKKAIKQSSIKTDVGNVKTVIKDGTVKTPVKSDVDNVKTTTNDITPIKEWPVGSSSAWIPTKKNQGPTSPS